MIFEQFANLRGGEAWQKREDGVFQRRVDITMHPMKIFAEKFDINNFTFNNCKNI